MVKLRRKLTRIVLYKHFYKDWNVQMQKEIWKDIPGYENIYQVSNFGNVKSLPRRIYRKDFYYVSQEKLLKFREATQGRF
ncbi:NUMOD4 domain-containing protein [Bacillus sp. GMa5/2]